MSGPGSGEDQVNSAVSIDIAGLDQEAACRRTNLNGLSPDRGELKLNPVIGTAGTVWPGLNSGQIRTTVPVEIGNGKVWARSSRSDRSTVNTRGLRCTTAREAEQQQQRGPQKQAAQRSAVIPQVRSPTQCARGIGHSALSIRISTRGF